MSASLEARRTSLGHGDDAFAEILAGSEAALLGELVVGDTGNLLGKPGTQVAVISRRPQGYFLTHIESDGDGKRYPLVNGEAIGPKAYQLKDSDMIELAGIKMEFTVNR